MFGNAIYAITPQASVRGGLRYTWDKKQLDVAKQQGQSALKLIQSAAPANVPAGVGNSLNIVA